MKTSRNKCILIKMFFLTAFVAAINCNKLFAQTCNQVEILYSVPDCFASTQQDPGALPGRLCVEIAVCVNQPYTYSSSVTTSGWTFNWSVTGPTSVTINPNNTSSTISIVWPQVGVFTLTLTATDPSGNIFTYCVKVNVKDKPIANFNFSPNNVCAGSIISFTNTTTFSGGGVAYSWDFGDPASGSNNYSTATDPTHQYNSAGLYTVTLIAYSYTSSGGSSPNDPPSIKTCCADTITKQVRILPGVLKIECISTVCAGDTATYTAIGCPNPIWLPPVGGTILSQSGNTVTIIWGNGNPQGQIQAQCPGGCIASVPVPIIPTNPVIIGNTSPCNSGTSTYSLPILPGTFYTWTLTNITTSTNHNNLINTFSDNNTVVINWALAPPGTYQLSINLDNKHICCTSNGSLLITPLDKWTAFIDQTICAGTTANLSVFPTSGVFNWTVLPPNGGVIPLTGTGPSFNPFFTNTGNYLVEVIETASTYCNSGPSNPQQIKVTVVASPPAGTISGPVTVCAGSQYTYTISPGAPPGHHYSWSITSGAGTFEPGSLSTTTGNSVNINWVTLPATISVVLQRNGNPSCPSVPVTYNVTQAVPGSISGVLNVCVDGTATYTITGGTLPSGETINWNISPAGHGTIISGQGTNSINVLWHGQPGTGPWGPVIISATTNCGNPVPLGGIMIHPKFTVSITKTGTDICQPGGVTLTANGPSGATYLWSPGGQTTPSVSNITAAGTYTVTVSKGGCTASASYTVEDPFAIVPATCGVGTCNGSNTNEQLGVIVIKPTVGTFSYQWYSGTFPSGTLISGATGSTYTTTTDGSFYVVVTYGNCQKHINFTVKKVCCPDINNPQITNITRNSCNSYTFTGTTPNPTGATITWDFGDGNTATGFSGVPITHVYANAGVYCVTFCVGPPTPNPTNCTGNCVATTVTVPIQASFLYSLGCNGCLNVFNTSTVITSNPSFVTYLWNFGDGNTSTAQNPGQHCYSNPGSYTVTLTITYNDGQVTCTSTAQQTVNYTLLSININPSPVCAGDPTTFTSSPGGFVTYEWDFGDGFTAYTPSSTHIYNAPGNGIPVTLTVMDALGNICTASTTINVLPATGPCTIQPAYLCPGGAAALSVSPISGATYLWEVETTPNTFIPAPGINNNNTYSATTPGFYHVIVTGANGCKCISNKVEVKSVPKPKAIIAAAPSSKICGPGNVILSSPNHLPGYTSDWYANANYGSQLSSGPMYFAFGVPVTTVFNLILTNEYGCKDTCSLTVTVNPIPPQPIITASPGLCEGVPITLTVTNYLNNITWNTGANTTSITVYAAGTYTATYKDPVTGCSSSKSINVNRRPPTDLFPHFCDSIPCNCRDANGQFTIYAPLPLVGLFASSYNIQWYFNNNPVGTNGANPTFSPAVTGTYHIIVTDPMTGCKDTSDKYSIIVPPCDTCDCKGSKWGEISLLTGTGKIEANIGQKLKCNHNYNLNCNQLYTINANYLCKDTACPPKVTYSLQPPTGGPLTGLVPFSFTPNQTGIYTLTLYGWCDGKICDSCVIDFTVNCHKECDCKGSRWGEKFYTTENVTKPVNCGKTVDVKCNKPITVNANYICPDPACPGTVKYILTPPVGLPTSGLVPVTFTPNVTGTYTLTLYGLCGNKVCDSCTIKFRTLCPSDTCCPYEIRVDTSKLNYTYNQQFNATIASQNFSISGLAGVPLTEVRAELLSYTITDNYNKECLKCVNLPYTWASIFSASNIGAPAVPPKITMYNSTVHPFNPTGPGVYQNPREVVWSNGSTFMLANNSPMGLNFILPAPPLIDCCELKGRICIKLTFRDIDGKECELVVCFEFVVKSRRQN